MIKARLSKLKDNLKNFKIDGYVVPKNDEFFSEYANQDRLKTISDFTGSAGYAIILKKNINPNKYLLKNNKNFKISEIIQRFNKINKKKIKVTWSNNKLIKEKSLPYNQLKSWKPRKSNIMDVMNIVKKQFDYEKNLLWKSSL